MTKTEEIKSLCVTYSEVNRLEDLIIGMLRYAPDTDLVLARASAKAASLTDEPELYAKAVTLATGGMAS